MGSPLSKNRQAVVNTRQSESNAKMHICNINRRNNCRLVDGSSSLTTTVLKNKRRDDDNCPLWRRSSEHLTLLSEQVDAYILPVEPAVPVLSPSYTNNDTTLADEKVHHVDTCPLPTEADCHNDNYNSSETTITSPCDKYIAPPRRQYLAHLPASSQQQINMPTIPRQYYRRRHNQDIRNLHCRSTTTLGSSATPPFSRKPRCQRSPIVEISSSSSSDNSTQEEIATNIRRKFTSTMKTRRIDSIHIYSNSDSCKEGSINLVDNFRQEVRERGPKGGDSSSNDGCILLSGAMEDMQHNHYTENCRSKDRCSSWPSSSCKENNVYPPFIKTPARGDEENQGCRPQNNQSVLFLASSSSSNATEGSKNNSFEHVSDDSSSAYDATPSSSFDDDDQGEGEVYDWLKCSRNTDPDISNTSSNSLTIYSKEERLIIQSPSSSKQKGNPHQNGTIDESSLLLTKTPDHNLAAGRDEMSPFAAQYGVESKRIKFTPPTSTYDTPFSVEAYTNDQTGQFQYNHLSGDIIDQRTTMTSSVVKDTHNIKRENVILPVQKPNVVKGDWLTSRFVVNNYVMLNHLGKGSYGEVRLCKEKNTNKLYAMKIMNKAILKRKMIGKASSCMDEVKMEVDIMKKLRHNNVLRLYEVMDDPKVDKFYLILEYMTCGDLMQITKKEVLGDEQVWEIMRQVIRGLKYLHDNNIVHGDIKPQNILVAKNGFIKISDFGLSKILDKGEMQLEGGGTPSFMAPEICAGKSHDGRSADIYSVGAMVYFIRVGQPPFVPKRGSNSLSELYDKIQNDSVVFPFAIARGIESLVERMMLKNPSQRLTIIDIMIDPWLQNRPVIS